MTYIKRKESMYISKLILLGMHNNFKRKKLKMMIENKL